MITATTVTQAKEIIALVTWLGAIKLPNSIMKLRRRDGEGAREEDISLPMRCCTETID
jgi:hypothetical protein